MSYAKNNDNKTNLLKDFVDESGRYARITSFMKDVKTERIEAIEQELIQKINKLFPKERYEVTLTGKPLVFQKGTKYLVKNLAISRP